MDAEMQICTTVTGKICRILGCGIFIHLIHWNPTFPNIAKPFCRSPHIVVLATNENWMVNFWTTERLGKLGKMTAYLWTLESSHGKDKVPVHTWGRLVAPMTRTRSSAWPRRPSNSRRNSVFRRLRRKKFMDQK